MSSIKMSFTKRSFMNTQNRLVFTGWSRSFFISWLLKIVNAIVKCLVLIRKVVIGKRMRREAYMGAIINEVIAIKNQTKDLMLAYAKGVITEKEYNKEMQRLAHLLNARHLHMNLLIQFT